MQMNHHGRMDGKFVNQKSLSSDESQRGFNYWEAVESRFGMLDFH